MIAGQEVDESESSGPNVWSRAVAERSHKGVCVANRTDSHQTPAKTGQGEPYDGSLVLEQ